MRTVMKIWLTTFLLVASTAYGDGTNRVTRTGRSQPWHSARELERVAREYAKQRGIQFTLEGTTKSVSFRRVGTNTVATIDFGSDFGKPCLTMDIDQEGRVLTNSVGVAVCGTGRKAKIPR